MLIKGIEEDYSIDKARIDASGFDMERQYQATINTCSNCGRTIKEGENTLTINGEEICENCVRES